MRRNQSAAYRLDLLAKSMRFLLLPCLFLGQGTLLAADKEAKPAPAERRLAVGKSISPSGSLVRREAEGKDWQAVKQGEEIFSGDLLLGVPFGALDAKDGAVRLGLIGDLDGKSPYPVIESAAALHEPSACDLDFTLDRGRADVINRKEKGSAKVRVRFHKESWEVELIEPGARVALEMFGRWPKGSHFSPDPKKDHEPTFDLVMIVLEGHAHLKTGSHEFRLEKPPGNSLFQWDSVTGCDAQPNRMEKLPSWTSDPDFTSTPETRHRKESIDRFRQIVVEKGIDSAIDAYVDAEDVEQRRYAVYAIGALDEIERLGQVVAHSKHPDVWDDVIITLRHWLGRSPGHDIKFYDLLVSQRKLPPAHARIALQLTRSFSDEDVASPELYEMLIEYLRHEQRPIRGLSQWHLRRLAPEGADIVLAPTASKEEQEKAYQAWKKLIPEGKLPAKLREKKKEEAPPKKP